MAASNSGGKTGQPDVEPMSIRLMDASGTVVLDSVATEYEDSFCLESFGELTRAAADCKPEGAKHFIIARVQTWDPKQPDKSFYSYYHAHHLNKILFQTQVWLEKKLIHRLHVLNPLTNTDIIGNVLYFIITRHTTVSAEGRESYHYYTRRPSVPVQGSTGNGSNGLSQQSLPAQSQLVTVQIAPPSPTVSQLPRLLLDTPTLNQVLHNHGGDAGDVGDGADVVQDAANYGQPSPVGTRPPLSPLPGLTGAEASEVARRGWTITNNVSAEGAEDVPSSPYTRTSTSTSPERRRPSAFRAAVTSFSRALSPQSAPAATSSALSPTVVMLNSPVVGGAGGALSGDVEKQQLATSNAGTISGSAALGGTSTQQHQRESPEATAYSGTDASSATGTALQPAAASSGGPVQRATTASSQASSVAKQRSAPFQLKVSTGGGIGSSPQGNNLLLVPASAGAALPASTTTDHHHRPPASPLTARLPAYGMQPPPSPLSPSMRSARRPVPVGRITQHGESVSADSMRAQIPSERRAHRRALSYMNTVNGAPAGPASPSLDMWTRNLRQEQLASARILEEGEASHLLSLQAKSSTTPLAGQPGKAHRGNTDTDASSTANLLTAGPPTARSSFEMAEAPVLEEPSDSQNTSHTATHYYDAFLVATDNDFLETSRIRLLFKENAVADTDAQLFEMPPYTGGATNGGAGHDGHALAAGELQLPCDVCFPTEAQLRHPNVVVRLFHQTKCYALLLLIMVAVVAAIYVPMLQRY